MNNLLDAHVIQSLYHCEQMNVREYKQPITLEERNGKLKEERKIRLKKIVFLTDCVTLKL